VSNEAISTEHKNVPCANVPARNCGLCTVDCLCHCEEREPLLSLRSANAPPVIARSAKRDAAISTKHRNAPRILFPTAIVHCELCIVPTVSITYLIIFYLLSFI
jgi:hypothetical protein